MNHKKLIKILSFCAFTLFIGGCSATKKEVNNQPEFSTTQKLASAVEQTSETAER